MPLNLTALRRLIAADGRSHVAIARAAGLHQPNLRRLLRGDHTPQLPTLERLAKALGCKVGDLL